MFCEKTVRDGKKTPRDLDTAQNNTIKKHSKIQTSDYMEHCVNWSNSFVFQLAQNTKIL